jgi:SAM-dependent methyltransferase
MPEIEGKKFLDLGCNEGFFCGASLAGGAARAVGVDTGEQFIDDARRHFPGAEFHLRSWDDFLPASDEKFDVILFASAIHYSPDQVHSLDLALNALTEDGTLLLECGIGEQEKAEGIYVRQVRYDGIERLYFTMDSLRATLKDRGYYIFQAFPSVAQGGDSFPRWVFHIRKTRSVILYNFDMPNSGKTYISNFFRADVAYLSIDQLAHRMMNETTFGPIAVGEANVDFFWRTIEALSMTKLAVERICAMITEADAEAAYVEGWLPVEIQQGVLGWLTETGRPSFNVSLTHGILVPKTVTPVTCSLRSSGVWFRKELERSHIDKVTAFSTGDVVEFAVTGWYDSRVPATDKFLMFHNGYEIHGNLLMEPHRPELGPAGRPFLATFKAPADSLDRISLRDYPEFAIEGDNRTLYFLDSNRFGELFTRLETPSSGSPQGFGIWNHKVPTVFAA